MIQLRRLQVKANIRDRIYWSFSLLVFLFVATGIVSILTINNNKKLSAHLSTVVDPSLQALDDLHKVLLESKMYTTNWVFLRSNLEDKKSLQQLHDVDYLAVKARLSVYTKNWVNPNWVDSMSRVFTKFEELLVIEKNIMSSLKEFKDYDDPVIKLEAERIVEDEVLPRTSSLISSLDAIHSFGATMRFEENRKLVRSSMKLRGFILILVITIIIAGFLLSRYLTKIIIRPIDTIKGIINDLGKGITRTIDQPGNNDEMSEMIRSVNNLSLKLSITAGFANEIGSRNFETWYEPLSDEDTLGRALITMRDNLKKSEERLEMYNKELGRKNKELEQFVYIASHDLQEPLRTTSSFVELLQQQYFGKLDGNADKYLTYILQSSDRMKTLINDLLDYSRIGNKKELKKVDCNIVLQEVIADLGKTIGDKQAAIRSERLPVINGYPTEIKQLFQNLVVNAIKFKKKGQAPQVNIMARQNKNEWIFSVHDNGIGIAEDHLERIFVIFQRLHTRTEYEGSGIGLAHCKKIVGLHGGKIWVESTPGEGATFLFNIPQINN